jgi:unsaturated chondroitin disaccharide hydrolase
MRARLLAVAAAVLALGGAATAEAGAPVDPPADELFALSAQRLARTDERLRASAYPSYTDATGAWRTTGAGAWTSGFLAGSLWLQHEWTGDQVWRIRAEEWQAGLEAQKANTTTHDVGFMVFVPFGNAHRLTGHEPYRQVALTAAGSLAGRYSAVVGATRSWNSSRDFRVIVDNMVNLELLFWAARNGGSREWRDMALSHALRTRADHVRPDGSTYQIVNYDPRSGAVRSKATRQGLSRDSTWSRGQAWAVHGFATAYRETGDERLLETARRTADWFVEHLPADRVPYWDFDAARSGEPRDSSAAAIAASGLVELGRHDPDPARGRRYVGAARDILASLASGYLARGPAVEAVLLHGTYNRPDGRADSGLVWGDYYLLEALLRLRGAGGGR